MVSLVALMVWRINAIIVLFVFLAFGSLDGAYMSSALTKVPNGAWFTIMLAVILSLICILWRFGKESQWIAESEDHFSASNLMNTNSAGETYLTQAYGGGKVGTVDGVGLFFDKVGDMVPIVFQQFVRKFAARPAIIVFFHMRPLPIPTVPESERYVISRTTIPSCYRLTIRHGYTDVIVNPDLARLVIEQLTLFITRADNSNISDSSSNASSKPHSPEIQAELEIVGKAYASQTTYIMGKEAMKVKPGSNIFRRIILELFLFIRENSRTKMAGLNLPADNLVEVGFIKLI